MSRATTIEAGWMLVASAFAIASAVFSAQFLRDTWGGPHHGLAQQVTPKMLVWDGILVLYTCIILLTRFSTITLKQHLVNLAILLASGFAWAVVGSIAHAKFNYWALVCALLSLATVSAAAVFQIVFVKEHYPSLRREADRPITELGFSGISINDGLDTPAPKSTGSAMQAALLTLTAGPAVMSTFYSVVLSKQLDGNPLARDSLFSIMAWGDLLVVWVMFNLVARLTRRARSLRTIRADLILLTFFFLDGLRQVIITRNIGSFHDRLFTHLTIILLEVTLWFEAIYVYKQTGSLGGALGAVLGDSTLSDLNTWQDAELEAPGPISYGPGFAIAHGALLSFAGLFTVINGVQSYLAQKSNVMIAMMAWDAVFLAYIALRFAGCVNALSFLRTVKADLVVLGFLFDGGLILSVIATVDGRYSASVGSAWIATTVILITIVFEAICVVTQYGPLKEVGNNSLIDLAHWKKSSAETAGEAETAGTDDAEDN